jgi:hypothetical protein
MAKKRNANREQLQDILLGIGAGLRAYDPENMFAGAGAAMMATSASQREREDRRESRAEKVEDMDRAEREQMRREVVSQEEQMRRESQSAEEFDRRLKATEEAKIREEQRQLAEMQRERGRYAFLGVNTLAGNRIDPQMLQDMARDLGAETLTTVGSQPPSGWSKDDLFESMVGSELRGKLSNTDLIDSGIASVDNAIARRSRRKPRRRVMATDPNTGESFFAEEDEDQKTPLYGDGGRDYAK